MKRWYQAHLVYSQLPMKCQSILPDRGFATRPVLLNDEDPPYNMWCKPKGRGSKHRLFVVCSCGRDIPFGRMHQHKHNGKRV